MTGTEAGLPCSNPCYRAETRPRLPGALVLLNSAGAGAAAAFALRGLIQPGYVQKGTTEESLTRFWAAASALRTWSITLPLLEASARGGRPAPQQLVAAGLVQLGDALLGARRRNLSMVLAPALMGLVHLRSARRLDACETEARTTPQTTARTSDSRPRETGPR